MRMLFVDGFKDIEMQVSPWSRCVRGSYEECGAELTVAHVAVEAAAVAPAQIASSFAIAGISTRHATLLACRRT